MPFDKNMLIIEIVSEEQRHRRRSRKKLQKRVLLDLDLDLGSVGRKKKVICRKVHVCFG